MPTPRNADTLKRQKAMEQRRIDYELYRQRMQHEDSLIGNRISWLVSSQAFLLTPYVILYLKVVDIATAKQVSPQFDVPEFLFFISLIEYLIVLIGLISCALTIRSTAAAFRAKVEMTFAFLSKHRLNDSFEPGIGLLRKEGVHGVSAPRGFPIAFALVWLLLSYASLEITRSFHVIAPLYWPYLVLGSSAVITAYVLLVFGAEAMTTRRRNKETVELSKR